MRRAADVAGEEPLVAIRRHDLECFSKQAGLLCGLLKSEDTVMASTYWTASKDSTPTETWSLPNSS